MMNNVEHFPLNSAGSDKVGKHNVEVTSPFDDHLIATVEQADSDDVEQALTTAHDLFSDRAAWLDVTQRIAILEKAIELMTARFDELAKGATEEGGKPLADSYVEMTRCIDSIRICIDELRTNVCRPVPMGINPASQHRFTIMKKEPIGVVVSVSAFNHPLNLIAHQVGPAIAAGCPVIVKPAENTPLSCYRLVNIFHQAGLPAAWCQVLLPENHDIAEALVTDSRVGFFSFIGSAKVGWYLRSKLAAGTRCAFEHGGVAPVIMTENADVDAAIPGLAKGGFYHAGQVCVSVQRVYAHHSIAREVADKIADIAKTMRVGDPLLDTTEVGPLIKENEITRVAGWVQEAKDDGAEIICGGDTLPNHCYQPTVIFNPPKDSKVSVAEIFGPVVCVYPYDDVDEAVAQSNALEVAFQASVYSTNIDEAMYVSDRLAASAVMINEHTAFRVDWMPFAGLRNSGLGVGGVPYTFEDMQVEKMIVVTSKQIS